MSAYKNAEKKGINLCLNEEEIRVLIDLEKITRKSVSSRIREGIEMYLKFQKGEAAKKAGIFSPLVFERPLRGAE